VKKILIAAAILGLVAVPSVVAASQGATPAPQTSVSRLESCVLDAASSCTKAHGLGVKPDAVIIQETAPGQNSNVVSVTDTSYRVKFLWHDGTAFKAGTTIKYYVHFDLPAAPVVTPSPSPTPTTSSPSPTPTAETFSCTRTRAEGNVGCPGSGSTPGYVFPALPNSNGYTTYVDKDCWGNPECQYLLEANSPADWQVTANEPAGNTSVRTYPDSQQLTNNWCPIEPDPGYKNCTVANTDTQVSQLTKLTSTYDETTPRDSGVIGQFAWDLWATGNTASGVNEIMVWVDNQGRGSGGADQVGTATIAGQDWTIYQFGNSELIWSLGAPGEFKQQGSGTVDLLAILNSSIQKGFLSSDVKLSQVNAGWEICSTGGVDRTFKMNGYSVDMAPR